MLQNGTNLPSLVSWRLKYLHMHYVWYLSCLQARTKETSSKFLPDKNNSTKSLHTSSLQKTRKHKKKHAKLSAKLKRNSLPDYVFSNHTLTYSMLLVRFKIWRRKKTPRGALPHENDKGARRKFSENTLEGTRITPDGRGFQTFLSLEVPISNNTRTDTLTIFFSMEWLLLFKIFVIIIITPMPATQAIPLEAPRLF